LVERIAITLWRQRRLVRSETAVVELNRKARNVAEAVTTELGIGLYSDNKITEADLADLDRLQREMQPAFGGLGRPSSIRAGTRGAFPAINIGTSPKSVEVYAFAPGIDPAKLEVSIDQGLLTSRASAPRTCLRRAISRAFTRASATRVPSSAW
jgi:Molecular chaperone (small heat shock protein)